MLSMRSWMRRLPWWCVTALLLWLGAGALAWWTGLRINTTASLPVGLYRTVNEHDHMGTTGWARGAIVIWCPPDTPLFQSAKARGYIAAGWCPGQLGYLIKRVAALSGDTVSVGPGGVHVNGEFVHSTVPLTQDASGRSLPATVIASHRLTQDEVLLLADGSLQSFDGRYFGLIPISQLKAELRPVFTTPGR